MMMMLLMKLLRVLLVLTGIRSRIHDCDGGQPALDGIDAIDIDMSESREISKKTPSRLWFPVGACDCERANVPRSREVCVGSSSRRGGQLRTRTRTRRMIEDEEEED